MDDWCAGISRKLTANAQESPLPFVLFILVANYLFLNIMLAISCDQMKEVSQQQQIFDGECETFSSYSEKSSDGKYFLVKHALSKSLSYILKLIEFNHSFLYSKLTKNNKIKAFLTPETSSNKQSEIELYFFMKELMNSTDSSKISHLNEFFLEFKGKIVKINKGRKFLQFSPNAELLVFGKNIGCAEKLKQDLTKEAKILVNREEKNGEEDIENETENLI